MQEACIESEGLKMLNEEDLRKEYELVKEKYNEFMKEAVEFFHEVWGAHYVVYKPFNEWAQKLGLDIDNDYYDYEQRFFTFVENVVYDVEYEIEKSGFEARDLGNRWSVLILKRFDQWTQDDFSSLIHRLFEMNGEFDFGTRFEPTQFEKYVTYHDFVESRKRLELDDLLAVYDDGLARIKYIQYNQRGVARELCERLNKKLNSDDLYEECKLSVFEGRPRRW